MLYVDVHVSEWERDKENGKGKQGGRGQGLEREKDTLWSIFSFSLVISFMCQYYSLIKSVTYSEIQ